MRVIGQVASVFAIALGVGLLVAGSMIQPMHRPFGGHPIINSREVSPQEAEFYQNLLIALMGGGAAFLTLGVLGLLVPWANALVYGRRAPAVPAAEPKYRT